MWAIHQVTLPEQHGALCRVGQHGAWHAGVTAWAAQDQALPQHGAYFATQTAAVTPYMLAQPNMPCYQLD
jgi:hypothetical protein